MPTTIIIPDSPLVVVIVLLFGMVITMCAMMMGRFWREYLCLKSEVSDMKRAIIKIGHALTIALPDLTLDFGELVNGKSHD